MTETTLTSDVEAAGEHLELLKQLGVRVAIDDFGTGYASLSQLQQMPVDILKIDRVFVAALGSDAQARDLLEAIVGVGRALSLSVIAEGVEERVPAASCSRRWAANAPRASSLGRAQRRPRGPRPADPQAASSRPVGSPRA